MVLLRDVCLCEEYKHSGKCQNSRAGVCVCGVMYWISPHTLSLKWARQIAVCERSVCVCIEKEKIYASGIE